MKEKPREKRERLFKNGRPLMRSVQIYNGSEYHEDVKTMWVAYQKSDCYAIPPGKSQEEFIETIIDFDNTCPLYMAIDHNKAYKSGKGPVGVFQVCGDGWRITPHLQVFPWATPRNVLRCYVSFLHMMKYKKIGVCVLLGLKHVVPLYEKCTEYGVLFRSGMIAGGDPRGDEYIYSIRGKR